MKTMEKILLLGSAAASSWSDPLFLTLYRHQLSPRSNRDCRRPDLQQSSCGLRHSDHLHRDGPCGNLWTTSGGRNQRRQIQRDEECVYVMLGNGAGAFNAAAGSPFSVGSGPAFMAVADLNGETVGGVLHRARSAA